MTLIDALTDTPEGKRLFAQEEAILDFTELVCEIMERECVSRSQLAERLGTSKGYISQILSGDANMTIRTMSDLMNALGSSIEFGERAAEPQSRKTFVLESPWDRVFRQPPIAEDYTEYQINSLAS